MFFKSNLKSVSEGNTTFFVPSSSKKNSKGPAIRSKQVFYNPSMELNRDISVLFVQWLINKSKRRSVLLDGLAATGVRGIRFANEINNDFEVTINDWNTRAFSLIRKNIRFNTLRNATASNKNLNTILSEETYDYVDIDPFGSPVGFIDSAVRNSRNNGIVACTATDTAALCGVYPKVCLRRYSAKPSHSWMMHEVGIRILIGFIAREAARYDKSIIPLLCHSTDHYFRVYLKLINGAKKANENIKKISYIKISSNDIQNAPSNSDGEIIGPLWLGELHDKKVIDFFKKNATEKKLNTKRTLLKLIDLFEGEIGAPSFYYTVDHISSILKISPPSMDKLFKKIKDKGFIAKRTHFNYKGFKTNAPFNEIKKIFISLQKT